MLSAVEAVWRRGQPLTVAQSTVDCSASAYCRTQPICPEKHSLTLRVSPLSEAQPPSDENLPSLVIITARRPVQDAIYPFLLKYSNHRNPLHFLEMLMSHSKITSRTSFDHPNSITSWMKMPAVQNPLLAVDFVSVHRSPSLRFRIPPDLTRLQTFLESSLVQ
jgi:hypothetical protein